MIYNIIERINSGPKLSSYRKFGNNSTILFSELLNWKLLLCILKNMLKNYHHAQELMVKYDNNSC